MRSCGGEGSYGVTEGVELDGVAELSGGPELGGGPELRWGTELRWRYGVGVEVWS